MKNLKILLFTCIMCFGFLKGNSQTILTDFSWASNPANNVSTTITNACGTPITITLVTGPTDHVENASVAQIPADITDPVGYIPVMLTFSEPVCNVSLLIDDLDQGFPSDYIIFDPTPFPAGISTAGGVMFAYSEPNAYPAGGMDTRAWVNWEGPTSMVAFTYYRPEDGSINLDSLRFDCYCCPTPENLECEIDPFTGEKTVSWDPVLGAIGYELSITYNDPECCITGDPVVTEVVSTTETYRASLSPNACYSWKVRTICSIEPLTYSDWSETLCSNLCEYAVRRTSEEGDETLLNNTSNSPKIDINIMPNPASNYTTITTSYIANGETYDNLRLVITDLQGRIVFQEAIQINDSKRIDLNNFNSGIYIYKVVDGDSVLKSDKIVIE